MEKRCTNCNRLLFIQKDNIKQLRTSDNITYNVNGSIEIICKCKTINKF